MCPPFSTCISNKTKKVARTLETGINCFKEIQKTIFPLTQNPPGSSVRSLSYELLFFIETLPLPSPTPSAQNPFL